MRYCLLKIAYDDSFFGFQIQPNLRTVQGEILKALAPIGVNKVYGSSRTDSHVRSASSIIEVAHSDPLKVCKIVDSIKGIMVRGYFETDEFVNLRKSLQKEYVYFCDRRLNKRLLQRVIKQFLEGKLESFSRDPAKKVVLSRILFSVGSSHTVFLFEGRSFSWNFVRIAAESIIRRSEGKIGDEEWRQLLSGHRKARYKGSASNLILYRTSTVFEFKPYESRHIREMKSRMFQDFYWLTGIDTGAREITNSIDFINGK